MKTAPRKRVRSRKPAKVSKPRRRKLPPIALLIAMPKGFKPKTPTETLEVEMIRVDDDFSAHAFVAYYNRLELKEPTGHWAVIPREADPDA